MKSKLFRDLTKEPPFGRWTVLRHSRTEKQGAKNYVQFWECRCECGTVREVRGNDLKSGKSVSCGCHVLEGLAARAEDLTGRTDFGRWTVLHRVEGSGGKRGTRIRWQCRCICGTEKDVAGHDLKSRASTSCGCWSRETTGNRRRTHGQSGKTAEYRSWAGMKARCFNPEVAQYDDYGGRGIRVCERWRGSFEAFLEDMGPKPSPAHSIDRRENEQGYDCGKCEDCRARGVTANCRWATPKEQNNNKRTSKILVCRGQSKTVQQWADELGVTAAAISNRLRRGWTVEHALGTPFRDAAQNLPQCLTPGCEQTPVARSLCPACYRRTWSRNRTT